MATQFQLNFVGDIEAASIALTQDRNPIGVTVDELCQMAGKESHALRSLIMRLGQGFELDLLRRLQTALRRSGVSFPVLDRTVGKLESGPAIQNDQPEELKLESGVDEPEKPQPIRSAPKPAPSVPDPDDDEDEAAVGKIIKMLKRRPKQSQSKVINSVAVFLGVGE